MISRPFVQDLAILMCFAGTLCMYLIWFLAFFNGGEVVVYIDLFGEMWVEYFMWMVVTPVIAVGLGTYFRRGGAWA